MEQLNYFETFCKTQQSPLSIPVLDAFLVILLVY